MGKDKESYEKNLEKFEELSRDLDEERRSKKKKKKKDRKRSPSPVKVCLNSSSRDHDAFQRTIKNRIFSSFNSTLTYQFIKNESVVHKRQQYRLLYLIS